tara:strand:- start:885 stop:2387 length:1503 start_codon:yes stop_codon:yes gene_type:complete
MTNFRNKLEHFLRDKYNLIFLGILLIAFFVRLYYFIYTYNQPLWWDEAEYLSMAKNILYGVPYHFDAQRPILFPLLSSFFLWIGEGVVRFFLSFLPSLGAVVLTYLVGKEFYNRKIALIASFVISLFWVLLFNTTRIHNDALVLFLSLLAVYFFWKGYVKKKSMKLTSLSFLFMALAFMIKVNAALVPLIILIFLIVTEKFDFLKKKFLWKSLIWFIIPLIPYFIYNYFKFGTVLSFIRGYIDPSSLGRKFQESFDWSIFNFTYVYTDLVLFILFIIGALFVLLNLIVGFDLIYKEKNLKLKADLFSVLSILVIISYFVFIERWGAEPRWLLFMAPFMFFIIGRGIVELTKFVKKVDKKIVFLVIVIILFIGVYPQLGYNHSLVKDRRGSYEPVQLAGLWIKENSVKDDIVLSNSVPQNTYYSGRRTVGLPVEPREEFNKQIRELKPRYLIVSMFEIHQQEVLQHIEALGPHLNVVNGYFSDSEGKQPVLLVYEFRDYDF